VCMDMSNAYAKWVREQLPNATDWMGQRGLRPVPFHTTGHAVFRIRRLNSTGSLLTG